MFNKAIIRNIFSLILIIFYIITFATPAFCRNIISYNDGEFKEAWKKKGDYYKNLYNDGEFQEIVIKSKRAYYKNFPKSIKGAIPTGKNNNDIILIEKISDGNTPEDFFDDVIISGKVITQREDKVNKKKGKIDKFHNFNFEKVISYQRDGKSYTSYTSKDGKPREVLKIYGSYYSDWNTDQRLQGSHYQGYFKFILNRLDTPIEIDGHTYYQELVHSKFWEEYEFKDTEINKKRAVECIDQKIEELNTNKNLPDDDL